MFAYLVISILAINYFLRWQYGNYVLLDRCKTYSFKVNNLKEYKGILYINDSIELATTYNNGKHPYLMLYEIIEKGDSISLKSNSDTLYLYKGKKKYWFIYFGEPCKYKNYN